MTAIDPRILSTTVTTHCHATVVTGMVMLAAICFCLTTELYGTQHDHIMSSEYLSLGGMGAKYCDEYVCSFVCLLA